MQKLMQQFERVEIVHKPRSDNRFPDALATLDAKMEFNDERIAIKIVKRKESSIIKQMDEEQATKGWQEKLIKQ